MGKPDFWEGRVEKKDRNWKTVIFPGIAGKIVPILSLEGYHPSFTCY